MKKLIILFLFFIGFTGCKKACDKSLRIGERLEIPIQFNGFSLTEIDNIIIYRIDKFDQNSVDTFLLREILWANTARSTEEVITDKEPYKTTKQYGYYESYLNNCNLIFDWTTGKDTLFDIEIMKSKEKIKGCHENDPNVRIDKLTFIHKGKTIYKNESIRLNK